MSIKNKPNELYINRLYDAPVKMVWDAWVDPQKVGQWWGPRGFTITTVSKDVRTGGSWDYTMHGPDGVDYPNHTKFLEVEKYSRLVYDHGAGKDRPPMFRVTVHFTEVNGQTKMEMAMALPTAEAAANTKKFIKKAGGDATWDRLAEYLSEEKSKKDIFVINRSFEAPVDMMFNMFTDPNQLSQWLPPTGFTMHYLKPDIKVGGTSVYCMTGPNDMKMYGKANYQQIEKPNRIVYTQYFCDQNENITRHPMAPTWPEAMLTTIEFEAEEGNKTRVCITWEVFGRATDIERETFHNGKPGMTIGWTGSLDKLEDYLCRR